MQIPFSSHHCVAFPFDFYRKPALQRPIYECIIDFVRIQVDAPFSASIQMANNIPYKLISLRLLDRLQCQIANVGMLIINNCSGNHLLLTNHHIALLQRQLLSA